MQLGHSRLAYANTPSCVPAAHIRTINLEGLLRTKQTRRDKDVADRIILERALESLRKRSSDGTGPPRA